MPKQPVFPGLRDAMKRKQTRRVLFVGSGPINLIETVLAA